MGEQKILAKTDRPAGSEAVDRDARKRIAQRESIGANFESDQSRARLDHREAEAPRDIVGEAGGAGFRNRKTTGRDHEDGRREDAAVGLDAKAIGARDFGYAIAAAQVDLRGAALSQQHFKNLARGSIAEQLAEGFLVIGNTMSLNHRDEIARCIAAQR